MEKQKTDTATTEQSAEVQTTCEEQTTEITAKTVNTTEETTAEEQIDETEDRADIANALENINTAAAMVIPKTDYDECCYCGKILQDDAITDKNGKTFCSQEHADIYAQTMMQINHTY